MILSLIAAVTLSLASTNDYTFTTPGTTNLSGVGMGPNPSYAIVRGEDVSFLREAYEERLQAVRGKNPTPGMNSGLPLTNDYAVTGEMDVGKPMLLAYLFPESFDPSEGGWREYRTFYRGRNNSFVTEDFDFISGGYSPVRCTTNWTFAAAYANEDLRSTYLPFVNWETRIVPPDALKTNAESSVLTLQAVTNAYHNLGLAHDIVTSPGANGDATETGYCLYGNIGGTNRIERSQSGNNVSYEYAYYEYEGTTLGYPSAYRSRTPFSYNSGYDWPWSSGTSPYASSTWTHYVDYLSRIGWKRTSANSYERMTVLAPHLSLSYSESLSPTNAGVVMAYCPVITTNNVDMCSEVKAMALIGLTHTVTETRYSAYAQADRTSSTTKECAITAVGLSVSAGQASTPSGEVVYSTDLDVKRVLDSAAELFGEPDSDVPPVMPLTSTVPSTTDSPQDNVVGYHGFERSITIDWIRFIFRFKRDFKAKIIED